MKNNSKIVLLGTALGFVGTIVSIGASFALYSEKANDTSVGVAAGTYVGTTGDITYKINGSTSGTTSPIYYDANGQIVSTAEGINPSVTQIKYEFALSAEYASNLSAQNYTLGNVSVSFADVPEAFRNNIKVYVGVSGYEKEWASTLYSKITSEDKVLTGTTSTDTYSKDIAIQSTYNNSGTTQAEKGQLLYVWIKFKDKTTDYGTPSLSDLLSKNEGSVPGFTVTWGDVSNSFKKAYVVGNGNSWTKDDEFAMAPDLSLDSYTWEYNLLPGTMSQAKCVKEDSSGDIWSADPNATLDVTKTYTVKWSGNHSDAATFTEVE